MTSSTLSSSSSPSPSSPLSVEGGANSLLTVGEACVHVICEILRADAFYITPRDLSRLSRTCRAMYISVRNLPPVTVISSYRQPPPALSWKDVAYWSKIAGVCWNLPLQRINELTQLIEVAEAAEESRQGDTKGDDIEEDTAEGKVKQKKGRDESSNSLKSERSNDQVHGLAKTKPFAQDKAEGRHAGVRCLNQLYLALRLWPQEDPRNKALQKVVSMLRGVSLLGAFCLESVDFLRNCHLVSIADSREIMDYTPLAAVTNLHIGSHSALESVAVFAAVHTLAFSDCSSLSDLSPLQHVHSLKLSRCSSVSDLAPLQHVHTLVLEEASAVTCVPFLPRIHTLITRFCHNLSDFTRLPELHDLLVRHSHSPSVVLPRSLHIAGSVDLSFCNHVTLGFGFGNTKRISISNTNRVDIPYLHSVDDLYLHACLQLQSAHIHEGLHTVKLRYLPALTDPLPFRCAHSLSMDNCPLVTDVSALASVHSLSIAGCRGIRDVAPLHTVPSLKLLRNDNVTNLATLQKKRRGAHHTTLKT